jgi:hypothetical protein
MVRHFGVGAVAAIAAVVAHLTLPWYQEGDSSPRPPPEALLLLLSLQPRTVSTGSLLSSSSYNQNIMITTDL